METLGSSEVSEEIKSIPEIKQTKKSSIPVRQTKKSLASKKSVNLELQRLQSAPTMEEKKALESSLKLKRKKMSKQKIKKIRSNNDDKPAHNLSKISRWLHITIFMFLDEKDIIKCGGVCKSLFDSQNDEFIWKHRLINLRGINDFNSLYKHYCFTSKMHKERSQKGREYKLKCLRQINAGNLMKTKSQVLNIKLTGHTGKVTTVSGLGDYLASGGEDKKVKLWNVKKKSCKTFEDHKNWITRVNLIDDYLVSGGADGLVKVRPVEKFMGKEGSYKHPGYIKTITQIGNSRFLSHCSSGSIFVYDLFTHKKFELDMEEEEEKKSDFGFDSISHNDNIFLGANGSTSECVLRDMNNDFKPFANFKIYEDEDDRPPVSRKDEIATKIVCKMISDNLICASDYRAIRIFDIRQPLESPVEEFKCPEHFSVKIKKSWAKDWTIFSPNKFKYCESKGILVAQFDGLKGIATFDLRSNKPLDIYTGHEMRYGAFDLGQNYLSNFVVTSGKDKCEQSEIKVWDITQPYKSHRKHFRFKPCLKATIKKLKFWNDNIICVDKSSDICVMSFGDFKSERNLMRSNMIISG
ncbi:unnamed protein product [Moneuplotes crassus]|uniref:F-box domain-containing protein n=1 Tax=Euplotes crassus TaxID=5936 RepID=A0AAD1X6Y9_EUPCR|nr:unnamed protein product [Moneuplotes crassus]